MTTVEIVFISVFSVVILTTFLFYAINSNKIKKKIKKQKEMEEQEKQKKLDEEKKEAETKLKEKNKQVVQVQSSENTSTTAVVLQDRNNDNEEILEGEILTAKVDEAPKEDEKTIAEQIGELSPELKTMLFTDILKPKF